MVSNGRGECYLFDNSHVGASTMAFGPSVAHASSLPPMSILLNPALANHVCAATERQDAIISLDGWFESRSLDGLYEIVLML